MMNRELNRKIDYWKNQLLDLGKRNKMIHYKETKRTTLKIIEPSLSEAFQRIVSNEESLTFQRPVDRDSDSRTYSILGLLESLSYPIPVSIGDIKTEGNIIERQKTLKNMRARARLALEEQGTNILYLVVGFLEWKDGTGLNSPWIKSPLVLVPVSLKVESVNAPFSLRRYEDDIVVNPTLTYLLDTQYGVTLPSFDVDEQSINSYIDNLQCLIDQKGWRIKREVSIGLLSFLKINMYKDLDNNQDRIIKNSILRAFSGESKCVNDIPEELENFNHDKIYAKECYQVVNADSSQQDAILLSKKGVSFVLQGPPGTGKSQTITNIIAEALAGGKKVLFVSEKMAALQVVYKRLSEVHLADFCLPLHSYKANKKEVLEELRKTLNLKKVRVKDEAITELDELDIERHHLNQYVEELHRVVEPLGISIYQAYGLLTNLETNSDIHFEIPNIEYISKEQFNRMKYNIINFASAIYNMGDEIFTNPWKGTNIVSLNYEVKDNIKSKFSVIVETLDKIIPITVNLREKYDLSLAFSWIDIQSIVEILESAREMLSVPLSWIYDKDLKRMLLESKDNSNRLSDYHTKVNEIKKFYSHEIFQVNAEHIKQSITLNVKGLNENIKQYVDNEIDLVSNISEIRGKSIKLLGAIEGLFKDAENISLTTAYYDQISFATIGNFYKLARNITFNPNVSEVWFSKEGFKDVKEKATKAQYILNANEIIREKILSDFQQTFLALDYKRKFSKFFEYITIVNYICETDNKAKSYSKDINIGMLNSFVSNTVQDMKKFVSIGEIVKEKSKAFTSKYSVPPLKSISDIDKHIKICKGALEQIMPVESWCIKEQGSTIEENIKSYKNVFYQKNVLEQKIKECCEEKVFEIDSEAILYRYKTEYTGFLKYFKKTYRQDRKLIRSVYKDVISKLEDSKAISLLQDLKSISESKKWISENENIIKSYVGQHYQGEKTSWEDILKLIFQFNQVSECFESSRDALTIMSIVDNDELGEIKQYLDELNTFRELSNISTENGIYKKITHLNNEEIEMTINRLKEFTSKVEEFYNEFKDITSYCLDEKRADIISFTSILESFNNIQEYQQNEAWLSNHETILKSYFGLEYKGIYTNWESVQSDIKYFENILECCEGNGLTIEIQSILLSKMGERAFINLVEIPDDKTIEELLIETRTFVNLDNLLLTEYNTVLNHLEKVRKYCEELSYNYTLLTDKLSEKREDINVLSDLDSLIFIQKVEQEYEKMKAEGRELYGEWFDGLNTDWNKIGLKITQTQNFKCIAEKYSLSKEFILSSCTKTSSTSDFNEYLNEIKSCICTYDTLSWIQSLFCAEECLEEVPLWNLKDKIKRCMNDLSALERWIDYRDSRTTCQNEGLTSFVTGIENLTNVIPDIHKAFCKRFYRMWLDKVSSNMNSVSQFKARIHNKRLENFCNLDTHQLIISQMRIHERLSSSLPSTKRILRVTDEMSILQNELSKKSRHMPLRKLFKSIPNLLTRLKPCLMMSPLSVSYFLEAETYQFDIIIFDEASQIFPQDAIGAILRGNQVIIAGDSKQLPPTNFFSSSTSNFDESYDSDSEEEAEDIIYSSILEEAARSLPSQSLKWHYRSKHENLIAFSNQEIYKNSLITFPSSIAQGEDIGVEYVYVKNGIYESRCNIHEARRCVSLVIEHIHRHPERSLGIIAFSEKQQSTIEETIMKFREQFPQYEYFFDENKEEPFFVKNLENVQGDERDTIIFSICYAKDRSGKMYMRFGPLGHPGGERRLNVAITRAKYNIKLVGSIIPSDIDLNRTSSDGVRMLRSYIEFAKNGTTSLNKKRSYESLESDDDRFSHTVSDFLRKSGYKVYDNVGCSDYTIDIAVEYPNQQGYFMAGIECDGNSYRMARTARDRDHLRSTILKSMGWNILRVWSTDWVRDPKDSQLKVLNFIHEANHNSKLQSAAINVSPIPEVMYDTIISEVKEKSEPQIENNKDLYGFKQYKEANWYEAPHSQGASNETKIAENIVHVLKIEQPIHLELLYRRLAGSFGNEKATAPVRNAIDSAIKRKLKGKVNIEDNFISMKDILEVEVRIPQDGGGERPIEYISILEIAEAMKVIVNNAYGISVEELASETARVFGFQRRGPKITKVMNQAIEYLEKKRVARVIESKVQILGGK